MVIQRKHIQINIYTHEHIFIHKHIYTVISKRAKKCKLINPLAAAVSKYSKVLNEQNYNYDDIYFINLLYFKSYINYNINFNNKKELQ